MDGALQEAYAVSRVTKGKQFLFSLSLNPPTEADVSAKELERTIEQSEEQLGMEGQPHAIVSHEKEGQTPQAQRLEAFMKARRDEATRNGSGSNWNARDRTDRLAASRDGPTQQGPPEG
ncbi:MAG: hypothetical protein AAGA34_04205 [Pseudomonadota bacterium]